jgi:hypothetical protein
MKFFNYLYFFLKRFVKKEAGIPQLVIKREQPKILLQPPSCPSRTRLVQKQKLFHILYPNQPPKKGLKTQKIIPKTQKTNQQRPKTFPYSTNNYKLHTKINHKHNKHQIPN